jgi:hypothetical protein
MGAMGFNDLPNSLPDPSRLETEHAKRKRKRKKNEMNSTRQADSKPRIKTETKTKPKKKGKKWEKFQSIACPCRWEDSNPVSLIPIFFHDGQIGR